MWATALRALLLFLSVTSLVDAWTCPLMSPALQGASTVGNGCVGMADARGGLLAVRMVSDGEAYPGTCGRRAALGALSSMLLVLAPAQQASADEGSEAAGEGVRKFAAKIPGMGPPDVFYPKEFEGRWKVQRLTAGVDFPQGVQAVSAEEAANLKQRDGKQETFEWRYVRNLENIVADREFNEKQLVKAAEGKEAGVVWSMQNPNVLSTSYPDGRIRELKVTKRSSTLGPEGKTLESSEFRREANLGFGASVTGILGVPDISASWVRSRYRVVDQGKIEGIVIEYRLPKGKQDPQTAIAKLKYRLTLERLTAPLD